MQGFASCFVCVLGILQPSLFSSGCYPYFLGIIGIVWPTIMQYFANSHKILNHLPN